MTSRCRHNRGFAMVSAIFTSFLIAGAVAAMMTALSSDVRRTMKLRTDAQLQQLMLASQQFAAEQLTSNSLADRADVPMPLPQAFPPDAKVLLHGELVASKLATVKVSATLDGMTREQTLQYSKDEKGWKLDSAILIE